MAYSEYDEMYCLFLCLEVEHILRVKSLEWSLINVAKVDCCLIYRLSLVSLVGG